MRMKQALLTAVLLPVAAWCQRPVISPGGVVNAATYSADYVGALGSIATIFGTNLAASTQAATTLPLPITLAGTSVSVNGIAAPLFYVSPGQINFQIPELGNEGPGASTAQGVVVVTAAGGASDPYTSPGVDGAGVFSGTGIFTLDASGCGRGAVQNVASDGTVSLNSPTNSVSPGGWITIYGTGLGYVINAPPDGSPSPSSPLAVPGGGGGGAVFDFNLAASPLALWAGRAPGLVGVDQVNSQVPTNVREGCAVPLQMTSSVGISQPVPISIHKGGGTCVDPPSAGYGEIVWETTLFASPASPISETDTLTVSLQAAPGKQAPPAPVFPALNYTDFGPACPIPGYRSLDAGKVTVQGPGLGPTEAPIKQLAQAQPVSGLNVYEATTNANGLTTLFAGQVSGLNVYQAILPKGTIQSGTFTVTASGGVDVGPFQSSVQIGPGIQPALDYAGTMIASPPFSFNWSGGGPNESVVVSWVSQGLAYETLSDQVPASSGVYNTAWGPCGGNLECPGALGWRELVLQVLPDPLLTPFTATGLTLGGQHQWKRTYRFEGVYIPGYTQACGASCGLD